MGAGEQEEMDAEGSAELLAIFRTGACKTSGTYVVSIMTRRNARMQIRYLKRSPQRLKSEQLDCFAGKSLLAMNFTFSVQ